MRLTECSSPLLSVKGCSRSCSDVSDAQEQPMLSNISDNHQSVSINGDDSDDSIEDDDYFDLVVDFEDDGKTENTITNNVQS